MNQHPLVSTEAFSTAVAVTKTLNEYVDFAQSPTNEGTFDGSALVVIVVHGHTEILTIRINPQGQMIDIQSCDFQDGRIVAVTNEYKGEMWNQLVEHGIPAIS